MASDGSVVGVPPPQEASPIKKKAIQSQVSLVRRDIFSSKTVFLSRIYLPALQVFSL
jgi:hypothetical protein